MRIVRLAPPSIDLAKSDVIMERALDGAPCLSDAQKTNARLKSRDLLEQRLEWKSVPFRMMIEPNRRCNTKCIHCDIKRGGTGELAPYVLERLLDEVGWGTMEIMPFVGGEPTLAPMDFLAPLAKKYNNFFNFITNGFLFTEAYYARIADITARVQFSFHSHEREVHDRIMPGLAFDTIVDNMRAAARIGDSTGAQILTGLVVMRSNLSKLSDYIRFVHGLGIRRVLFQKLYPWTEVFEEEGIEGKVDPAEYRDHTLQALETALELGVFLEGNIDPIFDSGRMENPKSSPYDILQDNAHVVKLFHPGFCISTANTVLIEWDGTLLPCCRDHIVLGNLYESSFEELWNGDEMKRLRESFFRRKLRPFCKKCMGFYNGNS